jgi:hypothetical protein
MTQPLHPEPPRVKEAYTIQSVMRTKIPSEASATDGGRAIFKAPINASIDHIILLYFCFKAGNFTVYIIKQTVENIIPIKRQTKNCNFVFSTEIITFPIKSTYAEIVLGILVYSIGTTIMGIMFKTKETINKAII